MGARIEGRDRAGPFPRDEVWEDYDGPDPGLHAGPRAAEPRAYTGDTDGAELRTLLSRLGRDASQLAHDEIELAKIEARDIAQAFTSDMKAAGKALAKDLAKVGVALSLAFLAGLALTAGAVIGIGALLGGAYWAGGLIVGVVLLIAAGLAGSSAARDLRDSDALRLQHGRDTLQRDRGVLRDEAKETQAFARQGARDFKEATSPQRADIPRA